MIERKLKSVLLTAARHYPVVTVTGPRQSGKSTLVKAAFPDLPYVTCEPLDTREYINRDPRGFLARHRDGAVLDEAQHVAGLLSYLHEEVDRDGRPGRFVLTGSQHFGLLAGVTQSLAGRSAIVTLLPPDFEELRRFGPPPADLFLMLWTGAYPRIHDQHVPADRWLADYVLTYVQRDVRQVLAVADLEVFTTFVRLCASRTAQELNLSALGGDAGVTHNTARAWIAVLEASHLIARLPAWTRNPSKRLVKAPKLHILDSGLACQLLGIRSPAELVHHPLRGAIFESWVFSELHKRHTHAGLQPHMHHLRQISGGEADLLITAGSHQTLVEVKSGATTQPQWFASLARSRALLGSAEDPERVATCVVYGGGSTQSGSVDVVPWDALDRWQWRGAP